MPYDMPATYSDVPNITNYNCRDRYARILVITGDS